jgi:hypothetical protein
MAWIGRMLSALVETERWSREPFIRYRSLRSYDYGPSHYPTSMHARVFAVFDRRRRLRSGRRLASLERRSKPSDQRVRNLGRHSKAARHSARAMDDGTGSGGAVRWRGMA